MRFALSGMFFLGSIRVLAFQWSPYSLQHGVLVCFTVWRLFPCVVLARKSRCFRTSFGIGVRSVNGVF